MKKFEKVFCVGLPKTGTTSLGYCFERLGFEKAPYNPDLIASVARNDLRPLDDEVVKYDCFEDWPWPLLVAELDARYPESGFILTLRETDQIWLESLQKHAGRNPSRRSRKLRESIFGYDDPWADAERYLEFYQRHRKRVEEQFADRPGKLLTVCWERGDGWQELCGFLEEPPPDTPFPHKNSAVSRTGVSRSLLRSARRAVSTLRKRD